MAEIIDLWQELYSLEGQTIKTLDFHRAFNVVSVEPKKVVVMIQRSGKKRSIPTGEIERAFQALVCEGHLSRVAIQERFSPRCPAYVAAILSRLPGVSFTLRPVRLWYHAEKQAPLLIE